MKVVMTGHGERAAKPNAGLDRNDVPHGFLSQGRWLELVLL